MTVDEAKQKVCPIVSQTTVRNCCADQCALWVELHSGYYIANGPNIPPSGQCGLIHHPPIEGVA